jgi:hypothetical protein
MRPPHPDPAGSVRIRGEKRSGATSRSYAWAILLSLLLAVAVLNQSPLAQAPKPSQYDVQAIYLYNFAKFVRWPPGSPATTLDICIAGQKTYVDSLTKVVAGETINTHPLAVRAVQRPEDAAGCAILFIDASAKERLEGLLAATAGKPVLTVSDIPGFLDSGGMIQFLLIDNRVRFSVDLRPVARSGITLSSELLKVAIAVNGKPGGGGAP